MYTNSLYNKMADTLSLRKPERRYFYWQKVHVTVSVIKSSETVRISHGCCLKFDSPPNSQIKGNFWANLIWGDQVNQKITIGHLSMHGEISVTHTHTHTHSHSHTHTHTQNNKHHILSMTKPAKNNYFSALQCTCTHTHIHIHMYVWHSMLHIQK